jgi:hypothetical protein
MIDDTYMISVNYECVDTKYEVSWQSALRFAMRSEVQDFCSHLATARR